MSPTLASDLTLAFIFLLFWHDIRQKKNVSSALWIPLVWFFIAASRPLSLWINMVGVKVGTPSSVEDGSPLDAVIFFALIVAGLYILSKRHVRLSVFRQQNIWVFVFLVYCFLAIFWSDFPLIALKRWVKILGHPIMALIILTESNPEEAIRQVFKRTAYLMIPLSILLCKYYPQYGRTYNPWTGAEYYVGGATDKNALGHACMIIGIFFFWNALYAFHHQKRKARIIELLLSAGFLLMTLWLLKMSSSATSLVTTVLGMVVIGWLGLPFVNKRRIGLYLIVGAFAFMAANSFFGVYENVIHSLGRNMTLSDRTNIWETVLKLQPNPVLGVGFESFWLGARAETFWWMLPEEKGIGESHNGYLETYLDLGLVGLFLFVMVLHAAFYKIRMELLQRFEFGQLRMALFVAIIIYNFTEAAFVSIHFIYAVFFLIAIDYPLPGTLRSVRLGKSMQKEDARKMVPALRVPRSSSNPMNCHGSVRCSTCVAA